LGEGNPLAIDMKEVIAEAAKRLLFEKNVKKLTVKDVVEECQITRQTFYYHFEDIPALMRWALEKRMANFLDEIKTSKTAEEAIRYFFLVAINAYPYVKKGMEANYRDEIEKLLEQSVYGLFKQITEKENLYKNSSRSELDLILRYHSGAMLGVLRGWTKDDTDNLDMVAHNVYLLITGKLTPF